MHVSQESSVIQTRVYNIIISIPYSLENTPPVSNRTLAREGLIIECIFEAGVFSSEYTVFP